MSSQQDEWWQTGAHGEQSSWAHVSSPDVEAQEGLVGSPDDDGILNLSVPEVEDETPEPEETFETFDLTGEPSNREEVEDEPEEESPAPQDELGLERTRTPSRQPSAGITRLADRARAVSSSFSQMHASLVPDSEAEPPVSTSSRSRSRDVSYISSRATLSPSAHSVPSSRGRSRSMYETPQPPDDVYDVVPLARSPMTPVQQISLSQGAPSVAGMKPVDRSPLPVYVRMPSALPKRDPRPERRSGEPWNRAYVVINQARKTRDLKIARGVYIPSRDDWELVAPALPKSGAGRYLQAAMLRGAQISGLSNRPRPPEPVPERFRTRPGPALVEPFASVLTEDSLLNRFGEYACGWKGCGAMLSSENNLAKHVRMREHVLQGVFTVGPWSAAVLYRCLWEGCDHPCFNSVQDIMQHMAAVHISKVLRCPYGNCHLKSHNISHLQRHVMKQHDEEDADPPRARADRPWDPPEPPLPLLPRIMRTDELVLLPIRAAASVSKQRAEMVRARVQKNSLAPADPELHVLHPPHMLEQLDSHSTATSGTATPAVESESEGPGPVKVKRRKRRRILGPPPPQVSKRSKLSQVVTAQYEPVNRAYVEIPYTGPTRRPGQRPVMFLDAANGNGHADAFFGPGTRVVAEIEINDEEEEDEIEEFEDEEVAPTPPPFSPASDGRYDGIVGNSDDELV